MANVVVARSRGRKADCSQRLFCFPPAASGASLFRHWSSTLPDQIEVCALQLPGRETRVRERPAVCMEELVEQISGEIARMMEMPFGFYGHSMGALIAYEVAQAVRKQTGINPIHLFVSAARPPQSPRFVPVLHTLPGEEFIREIERYGLLPSSAIRCKELMQLLEPLLRADLRLCDEYRYVEKPPLGCPLTVIGCLQDPWVRPENLLSWQANTRGRFELLTIPGGHQLEESNVAAVTSIVGNMLAQAVLSPTMRP